MIPNKKDEYDINGRHYSLSEKRVSYMQIINNWKVCLALLSTVMATIFLSFSSVIYVNRLIELGIDDLAVGYTFALSSLAYALTAPLVNWMKMRIPRYWLSFVAFWIFAMALMIEGPSGLFDLDDEPSLVILGYMILGVAGALALVPLFSSIIESVREKENINGKCENLHDKTSALFNASWALGSILAPIIGGAINTAYDFETACDVMMVVSFIYGLLFFVVFVLPEMLQESKEADEEEERLYQMSKVSVIGAIRSER